MQRARQPRHSQPQPEQQTITSPHLPAASVAAASMLARASPIFPEKAAVPSSEMSACGSVELLEIAAGLALQSASQLHESALRFRHQEGVRRTPWVLLQALALAKQFECTHAPPSLLHAGSSEGKEYGLALQAHVWSFYDQEQNQRWRGQLAWALFQLQQQGDEATLHELLLAMASTHLSTLQKVLPRLWLPTAPLLLTRVLQQAASRSISQHAMCAMLTQIDTPSLQRQPPTTQLEVDTLVTALISAALAVAGPPSLPPPPAPSLGESLPDPTSGNSLDSSLAQIEKPTSHVRSSCRSAAAAAILALSTTPAISTSPPKRKSRGTSASGRRQATGDDHTSRTIEARNETGAQESGSEEKTQDRMKGAAHEEREQSTDRSSKRMRAASPLSISLAPIACGAAAVSGAHKKADVVVTSSADPLCAADSAVSMEIDEPVPLPDGRSSSSPPSASPAHAGSATRDSVCCSTETPPSNAPTSLHSGEAKTIDRSSESPHSHDTAGLATRADRLSSVLPDTLLTVVGAGASVLAPTMSRTDSATGSAPALAQVEPSSPATRPPSPASSSLPSERISAREKHLTQLAVERSLEDLRRTPVVAVTPEQQKDYNTNVQRQLQASHRVLRVVPALGDCLFASVLLGCEAIGIDVCQERGVQRAHASCLRTFLAHWIRTHRQQLFDISGGDESWRGDHAPPMRTRRGTPARATAERMTLDECLDLLADTDRRAYDIPWGSTEQDAAPTNLGDYIPQLLAAALEICIVLVKAHGSPETVGVRDPFGQLLVDATREVMIVQSIRLDHWNAALPITRVPRAAVAASAPLVATAGSDDTHVNSSEPASADYSPVALHADSPPCVPVDSTTPASPCVAPTDGNACAMSGDSSFPPRSPRASSRAYSVCPPTPASDAASECGAEPAQSLHVMRRRIFPDSSDQQQQIKSLHKQLMEVNEALKQIQQQHAVELKQRDHQLQTLAEQLADAHASLKVSQQLCVSEGPRMEDKHRADLQRLQAKHSADTQQLIEQHAAKIQQLEARHVAELSQQEEEFTIAATAAAQTTRRIEELVCKMQHMHQDHPSRVRDNGAGGDAIGDILHELISLQSGLPTRDSAPFFHVSSAMVEQWAADVEELETCLGGPFHATSPSVVDPVAAQQVSDRLLEWLHELDDASTELSFMHMVLLCKKLLCADQLRPSTENSCPYQTWELRALLLRLLAHDRLWPFVLAHPCGYFAASQSKIRKHAAGLYVKAARAAAPDVLQQARLLVEQCKVLESNGTLKNARKLSTVSLDYPDAPLALLHRLHTQYPAAGPPVDRILLQQYDAEEDQHRAAVEQAAVHAASLEQGVRDCKSNAAAAQQAREEADALASSPEPRAFAQCMQKSRLFFHSDKRQRDLTTSVEDKDAQFVQVKNAWDCLSECRARFHELREYQRKQAALSAQIEVQ